MDSTTFGRVYTAHARDVRAAAYDVLRCTEAAEDISQSVFLALWARPESFDPRRGKLGRFLRVMATSRALDELRRDGAASRTCKRLEAEDLLPATATGDPFEVVQRRGTRSILKHAVDRLPAHQRRAVASVYFADLERAELAAATDVPIATARSRIRLGLERLRSDTDVVGIAA